MKKILIVLMIVLGARATAQEVNLPQYINHMADNPFLISAAYAGIGTGLQLRLNGVSQWLGVKNAPNTQSLSFEMRVAERFGAGLQLFNDKNGFTTQRGIKLSGASHLTLSDIIDSFLSFGITYNYIQFAIDTNNSNVDLSLPNRSEGVSNFDVSILYRLSAFAISFNASNLVGKDVRNFQFGEPKTLRRYTLHSSYIFTKIKRGFELEPSVFVEHFEADNRSRTDMNIKGRWKVKDGYLWAGLSYTFLNDQFFKPNAVSPLLGLKRGKFYLAYGLSVNTNEVIGFNYGTHMITLGIDFERKQGLARCTNKMYIF